MHLAVVLDCLDTDRLAEFWSHALDYELVHRDDTYLTLRAKDGSRPTLVLQRVKEPKGTKNRMHLDVHTEHFAEDLLLIGGPWSSQSQRATVARRHAVGSAR